MRVAIDIGSTVVKIATVGSNGELLGQEFRDRDFESGIPTQVGMVLESLEREHGQLELTMCSSANGGLRVGIVCLTSRFSGAVFRDQALSAGANPVFVQDLDDVGGDLRKVDVLLVGGGIDCLEAEPLRQRLGAFDPGRYRYGTLMFAGNRYLASMFLDRFPSAVVVENPLGVELRGGSDSVWRALRAAYLDDLIYKEGISELKRRLSAPILPTPEVVNRGFERAVSNRSTMQLASPSVVVDIGGATTDIHYTVDVIREDSEDRPAIRRSVARYVFTDLGVVASRDTTIAQLRTHPRLYEFLTRATDGDAREIYRALREGEYTPPAVLLAQACLFLCLDRFAQGKGPGLPAANLPKIAQIVLTGGASQSLDEIRVAGVLEPLFGRRSRPMVLVDRSYRVWTDGVAWPSEVATQEKVY